MRSIRHRPICSLPILLVTLAQLPTASGDEKSCTESGLCSVDIRCSPDEETLTDRINKCSKPAKSRKGPQAYLKDSSGRAFLCQPIPECDKKFEVASHIKGGALSPHGPQIAALSGPSDEPSSTLRILLKLFATTLPGRILTGG